MMTIAEKTRLYREQGIQKPVLNKNKKPILTSVWAPSTQQLTEIKTDPFHGSCSFTGRTFPFVVRNLIRLYSKKGEVVYDPMLGSGTTLYEGVKLKRTVKGSDNNEETVKSFQNRWKKIVELPLPSVMVADASDLSHLRSKTIHLVIMSFPWFSSWSFISKKDPRRKNNMEVQGSLSDYLKKCLEVYSEANRILIPGGYVANILGNTMRKGKYYPITLLQPQIIIKAGLNLHYQFWSLRVPIQNITFPWNRSGLDTKIGKADKGYGWDVHEDIIVARKPK